jgi:glycine dehydrogenase subunit 1
LVLFDGVFNRAVLPKETHLAHRYIPNTEDDRQKILAACGVDSIEGLLEGIPSDIRYKDQLLKGRPAWSEFEIQSAIQEMFIGSRAQIGGVSFLGSGSYDRLCPSHVSQLTLRGEFLTSYTPYQPESSQGTLQALFEFQSMVAEIFQMDVATASHYDGATALAEALLLAKRVQKKNGVVFLSQAVHPEYAEVCRTYLQAQGIEIRQLPLLANGQTDLSALDGTVGVLCAAVQSPNHFGVVEDLEAFGKATKAAGALSIVSVCDPLAMGMFEAPGAFGIDVVTAEGQGLGLPQSFGGPYLGLFCARKEFVRQLPGRLCGESVDNQGRRSYTLTLSTREQHIRREKATSNICTNQSLCALWATIWLASFGKAGFDEIAAQNASRARYLREALRASGACRVRYPDAEIFNEFVIDVPKGTAEEFFAFSAQRGIAPGLPLSRGDARDPTGLVVACSEKRTRRDMDRFVKILKDWSSGVVS